MRFTIHDNKITLYLLNASGSVEARGKAAFFSALGFSIDDPDRLRNALLARPLSAARRPDEIDQTGYGRKIVFECLLPHVPSGGAYCIRTVWIETVDGCRLVTAYPRERPTS